MEHGSKKGPEGGTEEPLISQTEVLYSTYGGMGALCQMDAS